MKLLNLHCKYKLTLPFLFFLSQANLSYAESVNPDLEKICNKQSIHIAAKLRSNKEKEYSAQDISMARLGAMNGCIETYKKMITSPDFAKAAKNEADISAEQKEKESIFDRLLRTKQTEDVNPMQKKHRTGGK